MRKSFKSCNAIINEKAEEQVMVDLFLCSTFLTTPSANGKIPLV